MGRGCSTTVQVVCGFSSTTFKHSPSLGTAPPVILVNAAIQCSVLNNVVSESVKWLKESL